MIAVLITSLVSFSHYIVCLSSIYRFDYHFGIFWPLYCLSIFNLPFLLPIWYILATMVSFGHSIVCPSSIYRSDYPCGIFCPFYYLSIFNLPFWLPLWYLQTFLHTLELAVSIQKFYNVTIFWVINY